MCPPQCPNCRGRQFPPTLVMDVVLTTERRCFSAFPMSKSSSSRSCRRHNAWFRPAQSQHIQTCTPKYRHTQILKHIHTKTQAHTDAQKQKRTQILIDSHTCRHTDPDTDAQIIHIGSRDSQTQSHSNTHSGKDQHSLLSPTWPCTASSLASCSEEKLSSSSSE